MLGSQFLGVIEFFSRDIREPDADLLELMASVGGQIGQFAERKRAEEQLRQSGQDLADFFENSPIGLHWVGPDGVILRANQAELDLLGYSREEYVGRHIGKFHADRAVIDDILRRLVAGETLHDYEARLRCKDGSIKWVLIDSNVRRENGRFVHTRCFTRDITENKRLAALLAGEKRALEMITQGAPLPEILEDLTRTIEELAGGDLLSSVLLLDRDGVHLRHGAAPSLPPSYNQAIDGAAIGPSVGSCGTAAFRKERVIVSDIARDPLWADFRELALSHGLRACWSTPILSPEGEVLGTFALYYREPRDPSAQDLHLIDVVTRTASIVIQRKRAEEERAQLLASLREGEEALREADRCKDEFLAMLAHELRNPLASIRNASESLRLLNLPDGKPRWAREVIERQARHLTKLVDDLLDVSRITRGKIKLQKEATDLVAVVRQAIETSRPLVESRHHDLMADLPGEPVLVMGDSVRLNQVVTNLLNNAAKYTEVGGRITVSIARAGSDVVVSVQDNGIGLAPDLLPQVFDMFVQGEQSMDRAQGGLGIGLTLTRRLVELHGGSVEARSGGLGRGSEFIVRLPAWAGQLADLPHPAAEKPAGTPRRVLIVDDNIDSAGSLALLLNFDGHEIRVVHDGLAALETVDSFRPEVVLLDIGLPKLDGFEVARRLRAMTGLPRMLLVATTGYGQEEDRRRCLAAGFDYHLAKPFELEALEELLTNHPLTQRAS